MVSKISDELYNLEDQDLEDFQDRIMEIVAKVLKEIYYDKQFREKYDPDILFFSLMMGDQDDSVLEIGKEVNRYSTYSAFEDDWEKINAMWG